MERVSICHLKFSFLLISYKFCREFERRKTEGEFELVMNEESGQNYQKKILPWEEIEVR